MFIKQSTKFTVQTKQGYLKAGLFDLVKKNKVAVV